MPSADSQPNGDNEQALYGEGKSLYEVSSQYKHWRFSSTALAARRTRMNAAAVDAIRAVHEAEEEGSSADIFFLTPEEELLLVKLYLDKIPQLCRHFHFPEEVEATAMTYLKRFYLKNTVMDWHPKNVMLTALYLASKTTNFPLPIDAYVANIPKTSASDVLDLEFLVAQSLGFELAVWHAHRALWGVWLDVQSLNSFNRDEALPAYEAAKAHVRASRLTDAELLYTPSQIAAACMYLSSPGLIERWLAEKHEFTALPTIREVATLVDAQGKAPEVEAVREVDRRLRVCKNPEKVVGSKAYLRRQAETEAAASAKRSRKAESAKARMDEDPFMEGNVNGGVDVDDDMED